MKSIFEEFLGENIKATYKDGQELKIARGLLKDAEGGFVRIKGELGTIIINEKNIGKMSHQKKG